MQALDFLCFALDFNHFNPIPKVSLANCEKCVNIQDGVSCTALYFCHAKIDKLLY